MEPGCVTFHNIKKQCHNTWFSTQRWFFHCIINYSPDSWPIKQIRSFTITKQINISLITEKERDLTRQKMGKPTYPQQKVVNGMNTSLKLLVWGIPQNKWHSFCHELLDIFLRIIPQSWRDPWRIKVKKNNYKVRKNHIFNLVAGFKINKQ